jgi:DNA-binding MurR/RpiR family transcriptional regulator
MTAARGGRSTISRIRVHYQSLPPSERKLADLILDFPGDIAGYSATELAHLAGVSKAAATRLFQRLGYSSFEEARRAAREERDWGSPLYLLSHPPELGNVDAKLKLHLERDLANMTRTFEALESHKLKQIVDKLLEAKRLWLLGYRNSSFLAGFARWQFIQIRDQVHMLHAGGETLAEQLADLQPDDLVVIFGFRRRPAQLRSALKSIHAMGVPILYITEPAVGATVNYATWLLQAEVSGTGTFDSYPAAMSLIHLLSVSMVDKAGKNGRMRLKQIEDLHDDLGDFH